MQLDSCPSWTFPDNKYMQTDTVITDLAEGQCVESNSFHYILPCQRRQLCMCTRTRVSPSVVLQTLDKRPEIQKTVARQQSVDQTI